jgi:N-acetylgalactosamine-6-sulfatase
MRAIENFLLLFYVLLIWATTSEFSLSHTDQPPNIVSFFADDQRNSTLGCAGHSIIKAPAIDQLTRDGRRFENMFVSHSTLAEMRKRCDAYVERYGRPRLSLSERAR